MTKAKTTKTARTTTKTTEALRKGFRAYVGMYGAAYERALPVFEKAVKSYDEYAVKGEKLETVATVYAKDTTASVRTFAQKRYAMRSAQLRSFMPGAANDQVAELEATITKLNKKIAKFSKITATKVTNTVEKTVKAA